LRIDRAIALLTDALDREGEAAQASSALSGPPMLTCCRLTVALLTV
jgi:hypothetical protein